MQIDGREEDLYVPEIVLMVYHPDTVEYACFPDSMDRDRKRKYAVL